METISNEAVAQLAANADDADCAAEWPAASWEIATQAGATGWCIPTKYGGGELSSTELMTAYERLAGACLTTAFILSQRDAAARRIRDSGRDELASELLRPLACGGRFATVGISQLTTSRQHGAPALVARETAQGFVLDGVMPWVTGADQADHIVAGAALADGRQILIVVPTDSRGFRVEAPLPLAALAGSRTAEATCTALELPRRWLLAGPLPNVMSTARGGTGGLETSCLALGHAGAAIDDLIRDSESRPEFRPISERLDATRHSLRATLLQLAVERSKPEAAFALRAKANALVLRATQAALTASKGTGFVRPHPAQRRARQALFFLVWSCPRPAAEATLEYLAEKIDCL
jgi:alkylation response protein AidB-like acyl-CoA dehydrogenase